MKCKSISKIEWRIATAKSNRLFAEADRLNEVAYGLLNDRPTSAETIKRFQIARDAANAKYEEAQHAWRAAKQHLVQNVVSVSTSNNINVYEPEDTPPKRESKRGKNNSDG